MVRYISYGGNNNTNIIRAWLHDIRKHKVNMNLVNMRYKTLSYLLTILKSGQKVTTAIRAVISRREDKQGIQF